MRLLLNFEILSGCIGISLFTERTTEGIRLFVQASNAENKEENLCNVKSVTGLNTVNPRPRAQMTQVLEQKLDDSKLAVVTANIEASNRKMIERMSVENASILCEYILVELNESSIKDRTRATKIQVLYYLSRALNHKSFKEMTKADILLHLNGFRKSEQEDPKERWKGTFSQRVIVIGKFMRWLYNPDEPDARKRVTPPCMVGIRQLKRKRKTLYEPSDVWVEQDYAVFLRYCPSKRDRCYVAVNKDTAARPHELLKLNVGDIRLKVAPTTGKQYCELVISGKTGTRSVVLTNSLPYVKEWLAVHPQSGNPKAPLFVTESDRNRGNRLDTGAIWASLTKYGKVTFPSLLKREDIPDEDKKVIQRMIEKPWNTYIQRHSGLTEKCKKLPDAMLRSYAGWTNTSDMPAVYLHLSGQEGANALLEAEGVITKNDQQTNTLQPKQCPNCNELNTQHAKSCLKCNLVLSYESFVEAKEQEKSLQEQIEKMMTEIERIKNGQ